MKGAEAQTIRPRREPQDHQARRERRLAILRRDCFLIGNLRLFFALHTVVLCLLVYYLLTVKFPIDEHVMSYRLPAGRRGLPDWGGEIDGIAVDLEIGDDGQTACRVNGEPLDDWRRDWWHEPVRDRLQDRLAALAAAYPELPVLIRGGPQTPYEDIIAAWNAALRARCSRIFLPLPPDIAPGRRSPPG